MRGLALALAAAVVLGGCATVESVREAQGQGVKRTFRHGFDPVFDALLHSAKRRKLEIVEQNRAAGRLVLSHGVTWTSLGERIGVFVSRAGERSTVVEVVSKPVGGAVTFPPDWPVLLFGDIEAELAVGRGVK